MNDNDEQLIQMFFAEQRQDIADDGFSRRVMRQLPSKAWQLNRIWTAICSIVGILLFVFCGGIQTVKQLLMLFVKDILGLSHSIGTLDLSPITIYMGIIAFMLIASVNIISLSKEMK